MAYSGAILNLLLSAPGDVPETDRELIFDRIHTWNLREGPVHGAAFVPMHWSSNTAAEFGIRPQESINHQLVDRSDVVVAIFWHRLGSPTGEAESGTVEELERAAAEGKYVAILRCQRPTAPSNIDLEQLSRLESFFDEHRQSGLIKTYSDEQTLTNELDQILLVAAGRAQVEAGSGTKATTSRVPAEVWATSRSEQHQRITSGQLRITDRDLLVIENKGDLPAYDVTFALEATSGGQEPTLLDDDTTSEVLPPHSAVEFLVSLHMGSARVCRCTVRWSDAPEGSGSQQELVSTVRF